MSRCAILPVASTGGVRSDEGGATVMSGPATGPEVPTSGTVTRTGALRRERRGCAELMPTTISDMLPSFVTLQQVPLWSGSVLEKT